MDCVGSRQTAAVCLALFGLTAALRLVGGPHPVDDAYVTFRYARSLATGQGLVYNPGEKVLGTSSILFAGLLAGLGKLLGLEGIPAYAQILSALCDGITTLLVYFGGLRMGMGKGLSGLAGALLALSPPSLRYAYGGMESSLATLLVIGALTSHLAGKDWLTPHLIGIAFLARPDALAVAAAVAMSFLVVQRKLPARQLLIFGLWVGGAMLAMWTYYGIPLPHAMIAKSLRIYQAPALTNAPQFYYHFGGLFVGPANAVAARGIVILPNPLTAFALLPMVAIQGLLVVAGTVQHLRRHHRWVAFALYPALVVITYSFVGLRGSVLAEWYLVSLLALMSRIPWGISRPPPRVHSVGVSPVSGVILGVRGGPHWFPSKSTSEERELPSKEVATFLRDRFASGETVALAEIGAFGY